MRRILLIDDDPVTHAAVKHSLQNDWQFVGCFSITEANKLFDSGERPSLVLIDRMLPDGDGIAICSRLRADEHLKEIPIIFLSSKSEEADKVSGLFAGADDYLAKPVGPLELRARILARFRQSSNNLSVGRLLIEADSQRVFVLDGSTKTEIQLTRLEYKLLFTLAQTPERVFTREQLLDRVWGANSNLSDRVVDTHLSHLRKKITDCGILIEALRGEGYRLSLIAISKTHAA